MRIAQYNIDLKAEWDAFVRNSRNGTFLFERGYMDYHADRFKDHSLCFYDDKERLVAVLPACERDDVLYSHQGLTYGSLVLADKVHASDVEQMLKLTIEHLRQHGFSQMVYKQIPHIYHRIASEEDEYWLWRIGANLSVCNLSSTVYMPDWNIMHTDAQHRRHYRNLTTKGYCFDASSSLQDFWPELELSLRVRHGAKPVHTQSEMQMLMSRFPDNIMSVSARDANQNLLAGMIIYKCGKVAHMQYSGATQAGLDVKAQDYLYISVLEYFKTHTDIQYFDFGTSNENQGQVLNGSLCRYKEGFGARGITYNIYSIDLK